MRVREHRVNTTGSRLNGRTVLCVVALLALAESRPLREQMEQWRGKNCAGGAEEFA